MNIFSPERADAIRQQQGEYLTRIRAYLADPALSDTGDVLHDVWQPYINWARDVFDSDLQEPLVSFVLKRCVVWLFNDPRYYNSVQFLDVIIILIDIMHDHTDQVRLHSRRQHAYLYSFRLLLIITRHIVFRIMYHFLT